MRTTKKPRPARGGKAEAEPTRQSLNLLLALLEAEDELAIYLSARNGLAVWRALKICHAAGAPLPQVIYDKLAQWAERLDSATSEREIARALELTGSQKAYKGPSTLRVAEMRRAIASEVEQVADLYKLSRPAAFAVVARNRRLSEAKVKKDYYAFFRVRKAESTDTTIDDAMRAFARQLRE